jgi:sphingolipid delta-4 desaturase
MASSTITATVRRKESKLSRKGSSMSTEEKEAIEAKHRDFFWTYTEEPHRTRRLAIIKAHPEVSLPFRVTLGGMIEH